MSSVHIVYFFFSSRRRHTRCLSDWSSDVCSSDLHLPHVHLRLSFRSFHCKKRGLENCHSCGFRDVYRSEERRVGKECRYRWVKYHRRKKQTKQTGSAADVKITTDDTGAEDSTS